MAKDSSYAAGPSHSHSTPPFASTSYTHQDVNRNIQTSPPPRKDDPSYATHTPLRSHNDPHAAHPFKRYYLGPSPVSSGQAAEVARSIKEDSELTEPIGIAVAGRPGFVWIRSPSPPPAHHKEGELSNTTDLEPRGKPSPFAFARPRTPRKAKSFSSALEGSASGSLFGPLPRLRARGLMRDASHASTRSFASAQTSPAIPLSPTAVDPLTSSNPLQKIKPDGTVTTTPPFRRDASAMGRLESSREAWNDITQHSSGSRQLSFDVDVKDGPPKMRRGRSEAGLAEKRRGAPRHLSIGTVDPGSSLESTSQTSPQKRSVTSAISTLSPPPSGSFSTTLSPSTPGGGKTNERLGPPPQSIDDVSSESEEEKADEIVSKERSGSTRDARPQWIMARDSNHQRPLSGIIQMESIDVGKAGVSNVGNPRTPRTAASTHFDAEELQRTREASNLGAMPTLTPRNQSRSYNRGRGGVHGRDVSRQSHLSLISSNTVNSVGTRFSEGSFGASGGFRARIIRAFKPNLDSQETPRSSSRTRNPLHSSKSTESEGSHHRGFHGRNGVAPGKVGTSAGGTKWVGQSFEVGARFWDVLERRRGEVEKSEWSKSHADHEGTIPEEEEAEVIPPLSRSAQAERLKNDSGDSDRRSLSPAAVLTAFARDAQEVQGGKQASDRTHKTSLVPIIPQAPGSNQQKSVSTEDPSKKETASQVSSPVSPQTLRRRSSITSMAPEALAQPQIEARQGWDDIVSLISSAQRRSAMHPQPSKRGTGADTSSSGKRGRSEIVKGQETRSDSSGLLRLPSMTRTETSKSSQSGSQSVFYTPMEVPGDSLSPKGQVEPDAKEDYFEDKDVKALDPQDQQGSSQKADEESTPPLRHMTLSEALSHPEPPLAADEKFPEAVHELLRRLSDDGVSPHNITSDTASDHAVAARPTTPKMLHPDVLHMASPGGISDMSYPPPSSVGYTGESSAVDRMNSLPTSETPLLRNKASTNTVIIHEVPDQDSDAAADARAGRKTPSRKKTVKFDKGESLRRPFAGRSRSANLLPSSFTDRRNGHTVVTHRISSPSGDGSPAPADVVLSRSHSTSPKESTVEDTKNEWLDVGEEDGEQEEFITRKSILRRDRMLVRNDWTSSETVPQDIDEMTVRSLGVHEGLWRQFMVVLRPRRIELWARPTKTSKLLGRSDRLHLAFVIPLVKGSTFLSIFSPVDRLFCLSYAQSLAATHISGGGHHRMLNLRKSGTNILLFDARSLSVSADWIWDIWRELGGIIPDALEVHLPMLDFRVKFPIPEEMPFVDPDSDKLLLANGAKALALLPPREMVQESSKRLDGGGEGFKMMSRHRIVSSILKIAQNQPEWEQPLQAALSRGMRFELAWRRGTTLDWVLNDETLDGKPRHWSVMCGGILKEVKQPAVLEFRLADHYPTAVALGNGDKLIEPPGIEGFLWRVKPVSATLTRVYITTHSAHCFVSRPTKAFPPDRHLAVGGEKILPESGLNTRASSSYYFNTPSRAGTAVGGSILGGPGGHQRWRRGSRPGAESIGASPASRKSSGISAGTSGDTKVETVASTPEDLQAQIENLRASERRRQLDQISQADGYIDVKDILHIRYLGRNEEEVEVKKPDVDEPCNMPMPMPMHMHDSVEPIDEEDEAGTTDSPTSRPASDMDAGGEEGLNLAPDRNVLRRARQFEVVMANGRRTRFEAYSASLAKEWVARLHDLSTYWKRREKVDALQLMQASGYDRTLIKKKMSEGHSLDRIMHSLSDGTPDPALLGMIWNWCSIMGCRGIIRCGQLFTNPRAFAPFRSRYYILIAGRLLCYKLLVSTRTARARQNAGIFHKRTDTVIHLRDAYLWSGRLADEMLAHTRSEGAGAMGNFASGGAPNTGGGQGRHKLPRIYADGLISTDEDEDCTFVVRYRPSATSSTGIPTLPPVGGGPSKTPRDIRRDLDKSEPSQSQSQSSPRPTNPTTATTTSNTHPILPCPTSTSTSTSTSIPALDDRGYTDVVLRARSRLERDLWVRCIRYEIERLGREDCLREGQIRQAGLTPYRGL